MPLKKIQLAFPSEILEFLSTSYQNDTEIIKEAAILELYREGRISAGKSAEILGMERFEFIRHAGRKGIPFIRISPDELEEEVKFLENL